MGLALIKSDMISQRGYLITRWFVTRFMGELWRNCKHFTSTLHTQSLATNTVYPLVLPSFSVMQLQAVLSSARQRVTHMSHWNNATILLRSTTYFVYVKAVWYQEMLCGRWQYVQVSHPPFLQSWREKRIKYPSLDLIPYYRRKTGFPLSGLVPILST